MRNLSECLSICLLMLCAVVGCLSPPADTAQPVPALPDVPSRTFGLEQAVPATMHDRRGALQLAAVCDEYARLIEFDGQQDEPKLTTTNDIGARLNSMATYAFEGDTPATAAFRTEAARVLSSQLEPDGEGHDLTPDLRTKSAQVFRAIAYGLRQVQDNE